MYKHANILIAMFLFCVSAAGSFARSTTPPLPSITSGQPLTSIVASPDTFKITGTIITLNTGKPIMTAVTIKCNSTIRISDERGAFAFDHLSPGVYYLTFNKKEGDSPDTIVTISDHNVTGITKLYYFDCNKMQSKGKGRPHASKNQALIDIESGKPRLLLFGGFTPYHHPGEKVFESKFNIQYYDYGCMPDCIECIIEYNSIIFSYLDQKFGETWRSSVRRDVIGLK